MSQSSPTFLLVVRNSFPWSRRRPMSKQSSMTHFIQRPPGHHAWWIYPHKGGNSVLQQIQTKNEYSSCFMVSARKLEEYLLFYRFNFSRQSSMFTVTLRLQASRSYPTQHYKPSATTQISEAKRRNAVIFDASSAATARVRAQIIKSTTINNVLGYY